MCVRLQSIPVPAHFFAFTMQPHGSSMEESSADRNQHLACLRARRYRAQQCREQSSPLTETKGVKHDAMSKSLLKEGMLAYHITAAITACIIIIDNTIAIPFTRANRLAAMRDSDEIITAIFTPFLRGPLSFTYALYQS